MKEENVCFQKNFHKIYLDLNIIHFQKEKNHEKSANIVFGHITGN